MMSKNREKQTAVLNRTQAQRREEFEQKVFQAVAALRQQQKPITFTNVARIADVSISYLYKWTQIKDYIQSEREQDEKTTEQLPEREPGPHSLRTLHEIARKRIQELEAEVKELKRQNELLRGHVAEIYDLRDECERWRERVRELTATPKPVSKVVPLQSQPVSLSRGVKADNIPSDILESIQQLGIKPGVRLLREIRQHSPEQVRLAIASFKQYRSRNAVNSPVACLLTMIHEEAEPNVSQQPTTSEEDEFDRWYAEAIRRGFCLDVPKNHLSIVGRELQIKVKDAKASGGYINMGWKKAKELMLNSES